MASSPGVYAVLLGSGISSAAGIKTGFGVVQDLVRTAAQAQGVDLGEHVEHPEVWWRGQHGSEPRYDDLLAAYAATDLDRRALLRRYFDGPTTEPTLAHHELGRLVAAGLVRVVITTNFDQLAERSIESAGVSPQVIADVVGIEGMIPLQHAAATVLKPRSTDGLIVANAKMPL